MPSYAHTVPAGAKEMSASCCDHSKQGVSQRTCHAAKHLTNTKSIRTRTVLHPMRTYTDVPALHSAPGIRHAQTLPCIGLHAAALIDCYTVLWLICTCRVWKRASRQITMASPRPMHRSCSITLDSTAVHTQCCMHALIQSVQRRRGSHYYHNATYLPHGTTAATTNHIEQHQQTPQKQTATV
jgi:hypothetical protein